MKKICLLHKLREKTRNCQNHQILFIIAGGTVQGDVLYQTVICTLSSTQLNYQHFFL